MSVFTSGSTNHVMICA